MRASHTGAVRSPMARTISRLSKEELAARRAIARAHREAKEAERQRIEEENKQRAAQLRSTRLRSDVALSDELEASRAQARRASELSAPKVGPVVGVMSVVLLPTDSESIVITR